MRRVTTASWPSRGSLLGEMSQPTPRRSRRSSSRSTGPGAAARSSGIRRKGLPARSDRPQARPDVGRLAAGERSPADATRGAPRLTSPRASNRGRTEKRPGMWRQIAVLGVALIAVALAVAVPLRGYLHQRDELAKAVADQQALEQQVVELKERKAALQDPNYIKVEARRRLQYVSPGETVYRIVSPEVSAPTVSRPAGSEKKSGQAPWYGLLWDTLTVDVRQR